MSRIPPIGFAIILSILLIGCQSESNTLLGTWQGPARIAGAEATAPRLSLEFLEGNQLVISVVDSISNVPKQSQSGTYQIMKQEPEQLTIRFRHEDQTSDLLLRFSEKDRMSVLENFGDPRMLPTTLTRQAGN